MYEQRASGAVLATFRPSVGGPKWLMIRDAYHRTILVAKA
jgi:hypothetical protein